MDKTCKEKADNAGLTNRWPVMGFWCLLDQTRFFLLLHLVVIATIVNVIMCLITF